MQAEMARERLTEDKIALKIIKSWWTALEQDTGGRARLRRCKTLDAVLFEPCFYELYHSLSGNQAWRDRGALAAMAGVLSHIKVDDTKTTFIGSLSKSKANSDTPQVSPLRFRQLISEKTPEAFYVDLIRVIHLIDKTTLVMDAAKAIYDAYHFKAYSAANNARFFKEWAFAYYKVITKKNG